MTSREWAAYCLGAEDALEAYAIWRDGEQIVGNDRSLRDVVADLRKHQCFEWVRTKCGVERQLEKVVD